MTPVLEAQASDMMRKAASISNPLPGSGLLPGSLTQVRGFALRCRNSETFNNRKMI
jgi:hypothetical protein